MAKLLSFFSKNSSSPSEQVKNDKEHSSTHSSLLIVKAQKEFELSKDANKINNIDYWGIAQATAQKLQGWGLPDTSVAAALVAPSYFYGDKSILEIEQEFGHEVAGLVTDLLEWRNRFYKKNTSVSDLPNESFFHLNQLLYRTYLNFPDFQFVLLLIAQHDAHYDYSGTKTANIALLSQHIFIPFVEILGIWTMRQRWLEQSTEIMVKEGVYREEYEEIQSLIQKLHSKDSNIVISQKALQEAKDRDDLFLAIKEKLLAQNEKFQLKITNIEKRAFSVGDMLSRHKNGYRVEELLDQLWLKIYCETEIDCYKVLWAIHGLGKPIAPRDNERFFDYVAYAQPNGYKGLESSVTVKLADFFPNPYRSDMLVRIRIVTQKMERINDNGVIQAFYISKDEYQNNEEYDNAWWNKKQIENTLKRINRNIPSKNYGSLTEFLKQYKLGSRTEPLYVFTPKGEIVILPNGSMPLDFAYQIHTDVGHHAYQIEVNGHIVDFSYRLKNGDIVNVISDSSLSNPDISWLQFVSTPEARSKIRNWLLFNSIQLPSGYKTIQKELIGVFNYYRTVKNYDFPFSKQRLDLFLERYTKARSYIDLKHFYDSIKNGKKNSLSSEKDVTANHVVERFVSEELANLIRDKSGKSLDLPSFRIRFCGMCRPVPGESIVGAFYASGEKQRLTVHTQNCSYQTLTKEQIQLKWMSETTSRVFFEFQVDARDRFKLLADILDAIYSNSKDCYLHHVNALTYADGNAKVYLTLSGPDVEQLMDTRFRLERVDGVRRIWAEPISHFTTVNFAGRFSPSRSKQNPYIEEVVSTPEKFYDREKPIDKITKWVLSGEAPAWQILHGVKRVGKTSLGYFLVRSHFHKSGIVHPVFIDLQGFLPRSFEELANHILSDVSGVFKDLKSTVPDRKPNELVSQWFYRCLNEASKLVNGLNLFIFLDEFDFLISRANEGKVDADIFPGLLWLFSSDVPVRWLISISDSYYRNPSQLGYALPFIEKANGIFLEPFDVNFTDLLVREPMEQRGLLFSDSHRSDKKDKPCEIVTEIRNLSAGIPYFIKKICYYLTDRVELQGRKNITISDLEECVSLSLLDGKIIFDHYTRLLYKTHKLVLNSIAQLTHEQNWVSLTDLYSYMEREYSDLSMRAIEQAIDSMIGQSILSFKQNSSSEKSLRIPVQLFARWIRNGKLLED